MTADIIAGTDPAAGDDRQQGSRVILDMQPIADVLSAPINRQRLADKAFDDNQRDEFSGK